MKLGRMLVAIGCLALTQLSLAAHPQTAQAQKYYDEVDKVLLNFMPTINSLDGVKIRNLSLKMNELVKKGEPLGPTVHDQPFGYCAAMGSMARDLWMTLISAQTSPRDETARIKSSLEYFEFMQKDCKSAIDDGGKIPGSEPVCDENGKCLTPTVIDIK